MLTKDKKEIRELTTEIVENALEIFAVMVKRGFDDLQKELKELREETNDRFDRIENIALHNYVQAARTQEQKTAPSQVPVQQSTSN